MTIQAKDRLWFDGSSYPILDVSDGKVLSCKECVGEAFGEPFTSCYRDSIAEFAVEDGILILKETAAHVFDDLPVVSSKECYRNRMPPRCEPGAVIPFTGFLVCYEGHCRIDRIDQVSEADRAFELEFDQGLFVGLDDLLPLTERNEGGRGETAGGKAGFASSEGGFTASVTGEGCALALRGSYPRTPYTWRFGSSKGECVLCRSLKS